MKNKKDFSGGFDRMDGDTTQPIIQKVDDPADIKEMSKQIPSTKRGPKPGTRWSKYGEYSKVFTLRCNPAVMEKIDYIAGLEGVPKQVIVDQAFRAAIEMYEAEHGPIDEAQIRTMEDKVSRIQEGENVIFR